MPRHGIYGYRTGCRCNVCKAAKAANSRKWYNNRPRTDDAILRRAWQNMLRRCEDATYPQFYDYGGRGITVCAEWHDLDTFRVWAREAGWERGLEIDRVDNSKGYEPENCRWATRTVNQRNTRKSVLLTAFGETKTVAAWLEDSRCLVHWRTLYRRVEQGWPGEVALTKPPQPGWNGRVV